ncbi:carbohydrate ABC transporter permease [Deinococcus roseus]|uniref:ABC transporter n=1 Tax=Deinococcus roseus TaxID=392414 RepID=A0ABQ2DCY8_9DEIO|nr:sugar ABC transporter permease [Deinococcus roseus]GGJ51393.1 ABC transporter [Deinococcus roseus]
MLKNHDRFWGLLFLSPWILGFLLFTAGPMVTSLWFSLTDYNLAKPEQVQFIGLANWGHMLTDPLVGQSLLVTLKFLLWSVPIGLVFPLGLAVLLHSEHLMGKALFRTLFYAPQMIPGVAAALIYTAMFNPQGPINAFLNGIGIGTLDWFSDSRLVMPALTIVGLAGVGNTMILMLSGLQSVPRELYESATIDGANGWISFWRISVPMISPVIFYNLVLSVIGSFQYFTTAYLLYEGQGGPENSALFYMLNLYKEGFVFFNMGYASTLAWGMFVLCMVVTAVLFGTSKRWVYYAGGE